MRLPVRRRRRDERGVALVEMIIAMVLASGVVALATALFISGMRANAQVTSTTQATMQGQGVAQGIERAVRNARRIQLDNCASPATNCTKVTVWTTLGGERACQVWTVADATIQYADGTTAPGTPVAYGSGGPGASLTFPSAVLDAGGKVVGLTYAVTYPSETRPVTVTGTVRSRTPHDTTSATTCGIAA